MMKIQRQPSTPSAKFSQDHDRIHTRVAAQSLHQREDSRKKLFLMSERVWK
jgi:hypothetical protein